MSEWPLVGLGDVVKLDVGAVEVGDDEHYPIVGVLNRGRGLLYRNPMRGADTSYKLLNRVRPNQIVYSRLKAFEGAITVAPSQLGEVFASQEFPTFSFGPWLLPDFFRVVTTSPALWDQLQNLSTGMGGRRERVKPNDFLTIPLLLPSIAEQRRIVAVIASVDLQIAALEDEGRTSKGVLTALRDAMLALPDSKMVSLADLTTKIGSGATPRGGNASYLEAGTALIRSQNVHDGRFDRAGLARISDEQAKLLDGVSVAPADVLINITGASVNRVCVVPKSVLPARVNQHVSILRTKPELLLPEYLAHVLRRSDLKAKLDDMSGAGSTRQALTKLQLQKFRVPIPSVENQAELVEILDAVLACIAARSGELAALRVVRADLLSALLSQEITVDAAVDKFVNAA